MNQTTVSKSTLQFLKELAANNNRDWFAEHKQSYIQAQQNMSNFADALIQQMNKHDQLENDSGKKSLYRIYSDVRFSKDKSPYHTWFGIGLHLWIHHRAYSWREVIVVTFGASRLLQQCAN